MADSKPLTAITITTATPKIREFVPGGNVNDLAIFKIAMEGLADVWFSVGDSLDTRLLLENLLLDPSSVNHWKPFIM